MTLQGTDSINSQFHMFSPFWMRAVFQHLSKANWCFREIFKILRLDHFGEFTAERASSFKATISLLWISVAEKFTATGIYENHGFH